MKAYIKPTLVIETLIPDTAISSLTSCPLCETQSSKPQGSVDASCKGYYSGVYEDSTYWYNCGYEGYCNQ